MVLPARFPGQWLRLGLLAVVGTGAILLSARLLPPPPRDFVAALRQFPEKEQQILGEYADLIKKYSQGDLSDLEFASRLEVNVVAPWGELTKEMSEAMQERLDPSREKKFEQYMRLRQESFEDLLASLRKRRPDPSAAVAGKGESGQQNRRGNECGG